MKLNDLSVIFTQDYIISSIYGTILSLVVYFGYTMVCLVFSGKEYKEAWQICPKTLLSKDKLFFCIIIFISIIVANISLFKLGNNINFYISLCFIYSLLLLSLIDLKTQFLPDIITKPLIILGLIQGYFGIFSDMYDSILGALVGYWGLWSINFIFKVIKGIDGMGYGDFKLLSAIGAWVGVKMLPLIILLSSILGIFVALIILRITKNNINAPTPFGPTLAFIGFIAFLFGHDIIKWYINVIYY